MFNNIKKNFGFGCMRFPYKDGEIDIEQTQQMIDLFISNGFNYFDTAHGYLNKQSEIVVRKCLTSRYKREEYILTNKLTGSYFSKQEDIRPLFEEQLKACGVTYFDFYLMHAQNEEQFAKFKKCKAYETALEFKKEGRIKHFGISFHDQASVLEKILKEYPEIEVVQIQFNYLDYEDEAIESKKCYDVCVKYHKPVIVMEPVKGGSLINLPQNALDVIKGVGLSPANLALRFAGSFNNIFMVLSGMSTISQMEDNISFMKDFVPLDEKEFAVTRKVSEIVHGKNLIACTACRYCIEGCPKHISIPDLFACMNTKKHFNSWNADYYYKIYTEKNGRANECIKCGKCEIVCPQKLKIRDILVDVSKEFDALQIEED